MIHTYLRAAGFRNIQKTKDLYVLLEDVINHADRQSVQDDPDGNILLECRKTYGSDIGIAVCGDYIENNEFHMDYYYPYLISQGVTTEESVDIERHALTESFAGVCDDVRLGVTLIFYIQNGIDVLRERKKYGYYRGGMSVTLSALAMFGSVLLPIQKSDEQIRQMQEADQKRIQLIADARNGDQRAMENLSMTDMNAYNVISKRIQTEDVFSIVESTFMPVGVESDQYSILGEILECVRIENDVTGEGIWIMAVSCNYMNFQICINEKDLLGEPKPGRRFRGRIWLQGYINYDSV